MLKQLQLMVKQNKTKTFVSFAFAYATQTFCIMDICKSIVSYHWPISITIGKLNYSLIQLDCAHHIYTELTKIWITMKNSFVYLDVTNVAFLMYRSVSHKRFNWTPHDFPGNTIFVVITNYELPLYLQFNKWNRNFVDESLMSIEMPTQSST